MDPAPKALEELPLDPLLGTPVPFACGTGAAGDPATAHALDGRRVTQCALSRVCGVCGAGLGRPIAFLGSQAEVDRNAFHFPPTHVACAEHMVAAYSGVGDAVLGQAEPVQWQVVTTAGFEYVRPGREDVDRRPTFQPNSLLTRPA